MKTSFVKLSGKQTVRINYYSVLFSTLPCLWRQLKQLKQLFNHSVLLFSHAISVLLVYRLRELLRFIIWAFITRTKLISLKMTVEKLSRS